MFGVSRTIADGKTVFFEYLRIEQRGSETVYLAAPKGRYPPTPFKMVHCQGKRVVFENSRHDFPQRITYWREDDGTLHARVEGDRDGQTQSSEWSWQRATVAIEE